MLPMTDGKIITKYFENEHYRVLFNQKTGFFLRCEDDGFPEPRWSAHGPELIDLSITSFCQRGCSFCYRGANDTSYHHLGLDDVRNVVVQAAECGTLQMALGGGNPNQHPNFIEILRLIHKNGIVPSYTTNGEGLTDDVLRATADYCGAMAVSVYPPFDEEFYRELVKRIKSYGIKVNLHAIIREDNLALWTKWLLTPSTFLEAVNAIIFLNYKPIGEDGGTLMPRDRVALERFFRATNECEAVKIGFDSCSISGIVRWMNVPNVLIESCEAARFSAFISEDLKMYPCSFMINEEWCGDLRLHSLKDIWQKNVFFHKFRDNALPGHCVGCKFVGVCKGGCRLFEEINFCR